MQINVSARKNRIQKKRTKLNPKFPAYNGVEIVLEV